MKQKIKDLLPNSVIQPLQDAVVSIKNLPQKRHFQQDVFPNLSVLKCEIAYNRYGAYCVPISSNHRPAAKKVLQHDIYEEDTIEYIRKHHNGGDIVHAGTYFGDFLPGISSTCSDDQIIWAFEPNPESFHCAQVTILLNRISNVCIKNAGLGENSNVKMLFQTHNKDGIPLGGGSHFSDQASSSQNGGEDIDIVAIDDIIPKDRNVSIIQLDVEGFEEVALKGALETIRRCQPILILEIIPNSTLLTDVFFQKIIVGMGYKEQGKLHGNVVYHT